MANKVLILTDVLGGGTGNHILSLLEHWDTTSWSAEIVSNRRSTARIASETPIHIFPSMKRFNMYPFAQLHNLTWIKRYLHQSQPDLLHTYFFWSIMYGRFLKKIGKIRILIENREDQGFNWGVHEYTWLRMTRGVPDRIICVSDAVKQVVMERERIDEDRIVVIRNGVEPFPEFGKETAETRKELGLERHHLVVGMVANFNRSVKGVSLFLDAVPQIVRAVPDARFLLLGRGKEEKALRDKARSLGMEPYVLFAGFRRDIHRYYAVMNVSALTSFSEGLSITILESMWCGIPVVATRVGGNPEVVVDGETGYLVKPGDASDFASHVVQLLRNRDLRKNMGEAARKRVETHFRMSDAASRYIGIYEDYCKGSPRETNG